MRRGGSYNLTMRLAQRECMAAPPGAKVHQSRAMYENVVPDTPVPGIAPPPNTVLSCFTPCGHFLVAFQPITNEVVAYRFKGLHVSTTAQPPRCGAAAEAGAAGEAGASDQRQEGTGAAAAPGPSAQQQQQQQRPEALQASQNAQQQQQQQRRQQQQQQQQQGVPFADIFEESWRCCPCPGRQEQISCDFCLVAHGRYLLVATASTAWQAPDGAAGVAALVPRVDATTFHLVELESGSLLDSHTLRGDYVELARNQGAHLAGEMLLVLGLATQTLHMLHLLPSGRFRYLHSLGPHCRDDDELVLTQHEERERRLRQQQEERRRQRQDAMQRPPSSCGLDRVGSATSFGALQPSASQLGPSWQHGGAAGAAGTAAAAVGSGAAVGAAQGADPGPAGHAPAAAAAAAAAASEGAIEEPEKGASPFLGGLKQCLLAYLFREAQRQAETAAELGGGAAGASSTGSLLSAAAAPGPATGGYASGGSSTSLAGLAASAGGQAPSQPQPQPHWRRPLARFYYYFEAYAELLMWKAQLLDEQRLLIHWCAPEMLAGPQRHHGHALSAHAGQHGGSYLMLYNWASASVERLFAAHSPEFVSWYLQQPAAFHPGACACGCYSDWERLAAPLGASRAAQEAHQRDPGLAAKELRHRLAEEIPACPPLRQATPYLDPDLYCFDERAVGGCVRPHHLPHRSLKFKCRCRPERLRFRLDPEHIAASAPAGARARGGGAARGALHAVYLFHPVQPFLLVVLQDVETAMAERLNVFTRL